MRRFFAVYIVLLLAVAFTSQVFAGEAVNVAKIKFREARKVYVAAKEKLSDAQIESLLTFGKPEKREAVAKVKNARRALKIAKKTYKEALRVLHNAEMARDSKINRSPWK